MSSPNLLNVRERASSHVSIRRRLLQSTSRQRAGQPKQQEAELRKSSTMTTFRPKLERLLQEGKVQQIVQTDPHSKANLYYNNHLNDLEKELAAAKKSLSSMTTKGDQKQANINKLKDEVLRAEREASIIAAEVDKTKQSYESVTNKLKERKEDLSQQYWAEKCLEAKRESVAADSALLKVRYQYLNKELHQCQDAIKQLKTKWHKLNEQNTQLNKVCVQAEAIAREQSSQKEQLLQAMDSQLHQRQLLDEIREDKLKKDREINAISPALVEQQELAKYMEILHAHQLLGIILKSKNNALMSQYSGVQRAFSILRQGFNSSQPDEVLRRMETQDEAYEQSLKVVSNLQKKLSELDEKVQSLTKQRERILSQEGQMAKLPKNYYQGRQKDIYGLLCSKMDKLNAKKKGDEILQTNLITWAQRYFATYGIKQDRNREFTVCLAQLVDVIKAALK